ncbi:MAG: protein-glutamate O-methyltransferase CheR [Desulfobacteraceae bacterium]|nr:protein-glutamate O-methyltransferase CheR [Desulfobacteraceae bacterium]MCB9494134.1 protein-glutamate O-methyltransferase CheR [Desulfobacteraceae bacterium]
MLNNNTHQNFELGEKDFNFIRNRVYEECGINLHEGKKELVRSRLSKRLRDLGLKSFKEYKLFLEQNHEESINLLNAISTNLTSFFREKKHFDFLTEKGLEALLASRQRDKRVLKCWSAGCSTGEEPYSLACALDMKRDFYNFDFHIMATDISTDVLDKAKMGIYEMSRVAGVEISILKKYFQKGTGQRKGSVRVGREIRSKINFLRFNLMEPYRFNFDFDVIFCRNVMIYFEKKIQSAVVNKFYNVLNPGGYLFVGHSESLMNIEHKFKYVEPTIYQK